MCTVNLQMLAFLAKRAHCSTVCLPKFITIERDSRCPSIASLFVSNGVSSFHSSSSVDSLHPSLLSYNGFTRIINSQSCSKSRLCICKLFRTKFPFRWDFAERADIRFERPLFERLKEFFNTTIVKHFLKPWKSKAAAAMSKGCLLSSFSDCVTQMSARKYLLVCHSHSLIKIGVNERITCVITKPYLKYRNTPNIHKISESFLPNAKQ